MKRIIYIFLTIVLCLILSSLVYELIYIFFAPIDYSLLSVIAILLFILSTLGWFFLGKHRWIIIYIDKKHPDICKKFKSIYNYIISIYISS